LKKEKRGGMAEKTKTVSLWGGGMKRREDHLTEAGREEGDWETVKKTMHTSRAQT